MDTQITAAGTAAPTPSVYRGDSPTLADQFIDHGRYLRAWSPKTVLIYRRALTAFGDTALTKPALAAWVVALRHRGHSLGGVNIFTRAISSYLSWLHEEEFTLNRFRPWSAEPFATVELFK